MEETDFHCIAAKYLTNSPWGLFILTCVFFFFFAELKKNDEGSPTAMKILHPMFAVATAMLILISIAEANEIVYTLSGYGQLVTSSTLR